MRVVIAEDSVLLREGLVRLIEAAGLAVVGTAGDVAELNDLLGRVEADVVVLDVRMPPTFTDEGIRAALTLQRRDPPLPVLVLSQYVEERYASELLSRGTGGIGYLLKDRVADVEQFLDSLRRVAAGGTVLDPEVVAQLMVRRKASPIDRLTPRELETLSLMAEGRSNSAIAAGLHISESAVAKNVNNIFTKFDLSPADTDHRRVLAVLQFINK
ncbi:response regulator transcription factor [Nakamurella multipartita]|uniref:Two component transcriptional regulator, LuxR family n=1 Tax=Nakamurella multipartita (strain ATCC 700099 / DSM 44233 / CIP 104796 / JCM 9543 / NBRC 105858 / Y-104) TaxID=479431 RepID=C8XGS6_NAKMY|nr:response regulator transcription factor [Nakamurella multipartita]ACV80157.1 two component transcriptional regulator, LuxR family [Nakamurella multipartita DSM 44233]